MSKKLQRHKKRLAVLRAADQALYSLWRQSEVGSEEYHAINTLQTKYIHPAIRKLEAEAGEPK